MTQGRAAIARLFNSTRTWYRTRLHSSTLAQHICSEGEVLKVQEARCHIACVVGVAGPLQHFDNRKLERP